MITSSLIFGIVLVSVITALLALFLEAAHSYIANYGQVRITVNNEKDLEVKGGAPLLSTLIGTKIFIPSACGGKGTCGYCKVRVLEGGGPLLPTETPYLSREEIQQDMRISCQIKVKSDMKIAVPQELFNVREYKVLTERIEERTLFIKGIRLKLLEPEDGISFVPGQYIQLQVPAYKLSSQPEFRAYSIASSARDHHFLDLIISKVEKGIVSTYVHDYLREKDELIARGPFGGFHLLESDRDILLIATGSGLAPIMSILHQIDYEHIERKTTLFFGTRTSSELFYYDELRSFERRLKQFTFVPTLSRAQSGDNWIGERGRVTKLIETYINDNAAVDVHIWGSPPMVQSCVDLLIKKGIPADRIIFDKFE
ncbi:MAG: FAD-binding oxidoreductase [Candidatus Mariimomonas ferrooxydans]